MAGLARCLRLCLQEYSNWETDEVITKELVRNLGIALACVFLTTLLLLANFLGSLMVLLCVAIVLVYNILHCTALHCTAIYCTAITCTKLHCTALHYTALHCTVLQYTVIHCTALPCTVLHGAVSHSTAIYCTVLFGSNQVLFRTFPVIFGTNSVIFIRPGVAQAVLETSLLLIN